MRIGICVSLENAPKAVEAGFDYVEVSASQLAASEIGPYEGLPVETTNLFFPQIDLYRSDEWRSYAEGLFEKASALGVKLMVIGSGGARKRRPDMASPREAEERFAEIVAQMQKLTEITLAPESLNRTETDCYNSMRILAQDARTHNFGFTADAFHILYEWNADGQVVSLKDLFESEIPTKPSHVHLAALEGRAAPKIGDPQLEAFFYRLKEQGYDDRISLECNGLSTENYSEAIAVVHSYL